MLCVSLILQRRYLPDRASIKLLKGGTIKARAGPIGNKT
jgi:hypothetical protein